MENICKHVEKYDFYGLKEQFFKLARFVRSIKTISDRLVEGTTPKLWKLFKKKGIYVVKILNFPGHVISTLWPSSFSGNCDKFQEISEFIPGNSFLSCGNTVGDILNTKAPWQVVWTAAFFATQLQGQ